MKSLSLLSPLYGACRQLWRYLDELTADLGVSHVEALILIYLADRGPCSTAELLRIFGLRKSTMTSTLDRMTDRHLITREISRGDRRSFDIQLAPLGKATAKPVGAVIADLDELLAGNVSERDLQGHRKVISAIHHVTTALERENRQPGASTARRGGMT